MHRQAIPPVHLQSAMKHTAVISPADVGGVCSIAGPPTHCFWEKKTRKKKINPPSRLFSAKSHYACTGIVALFDIIM